ncbi:MAG: 16S rRNA (cytosine(1402)-N(4))-methyltransferase RsmH [Deinococcota bacterium]
MNETAPPHIPVMLEPCLEALALHPGDWCIDGTFGAGGHSRALLERGCCVLALDRDDRAQEFVRPLEAQYPEQFVFARANFQDMAEVALKRGIVPKGVLLDLGVSSMQLDEAARGFAFRQDGPLDMRMGLNDISAEALVNGASQDELAAIIYKYGEDRYSRRIARAIVEVRQIAPITTTGELMKVVAGAYPGRAGSRHDHPARRTFQALRIVVNDELKALENALAAAASCLAEDGRLAVLSYHSLEDRIVKVFMRSGVLTPLHKKPQTASEQELKTNPRARSAKLRSAVKPAAKHQDTKHQDTLITTPSQVHVTPERTPSS